MSPTTVHVSNISPKTTEKEVQDFFSFCGKITSLSLTPSSGEPDATQSATVTFEKETAAKTALLLDHTQLGPSSVHVSAAHSLDDIADDKAASAAEAKDENNHPLEQEDKPRSRIVAEYLAHGYVISDQAIQKAITLDQRHGFSYRFTNALSNFEKKFHAADKARDFDASHGITDKAANAWKELNTYSEKALGTPTGKKIRDFYQQTDKQVRDIHSEARRLADLKGGKPGEETGAAEVPVAPTGAPVGEPATAAPEASETPSKA